MQSGAQNIINNYEVHCRLEYMKEYWYFWGERILSNVMWPSSRVERQETLLNAQNVTLCQHNNGRYQVIRNRYVGNNKVLACKILYLLYHRLTQVVSEKGRKTVVCLFEQRNSESCGWISEQSKIWGIRLTREEFLEFREVRVRVGAPWRGVCALASVLTSGWWHVSTVWPVTTRRVWPRRQQVPVRCSRFHAPRTERRRRTERSFWAASCPWACEPSTCFPSLLSSQTNAAATHNAKPL